MSVNNIAEDLPLWNRIYKLCRGDSDLLDEVGDIWRQLSEAERARFEQITAHYYQLAHNVKVTSAWYRVSRNSITLCWKMHWDVGIWIYPLLEYPARPGWPISDGTWAWYARLMTFDPVMQDVGSSLRIKFCVQKRCKLVVGEIVTNPNEVTGMLRTGADSESRESAGCENRQI